MLRAKIAMLALAPALLLGYAACAGATGDDNEPGDGAFIGEVVESGGDAIRGKPPIVGTFRNESSDYGIAVLTLKTDYTYHKEDAIVCVKEPCINPEVNGTYWYLTRDGAKYLVLTDEAGRGVGIYTYKMGNYDTLYIAPLRSNAWQTLVRSEMSWCGVPRDCTLQDLPVGICAGTWMCAQAVCRYECGQIE